LGTTKIVSILGEKIGANAYRIAAYAEAPSKGIRRGEVENITSVVECVLPTIEKIRSLAPADVDLHNVYIGIAGQHIKHIAHSVSTIRRDNFAIIEADEIEQLKKDARNLYVSPGEEILHVITYMFSIDNIDGITDPVGRTGTKLTGHFHIIVSNESSRIHTNKCVQRLKLSLKQRILEPIASARAVLTPEERELGVAMIDMGGGTTDIIVFADKKEQYSTVIPLGGDAITKDIKSAIACDYHGIVSFEQAEQIKQVYGVCYQLVIGGDIEKDYTIKIPGVNGRQDVEISRKYLAKVIECRMDEYAQCITNALNQIKRKCNLDAGIVFTGGASKMKYFREFFAMKKGWKNVRVVSPRYVCDSPNEICDPKYSTAVGLIMCGFDNEAGLISDDILGISNYSDNPVVEHNPVEKKIAVPAEPAPEPEKTVQNDKPTGGKKLDNILNRLWQILGEDEVDNDDNEDEK
jgi:cell division protein FtsA